MDRTQWQKERRLIYGKYAHHGGYHYYPTDEQVRNWLAEVSLNVLEMVEGDGYRHYLVKKGFPSIGGKD